MRQIVLDTETTGLEPAAGHRIIEIGCVELVNRRPTQNRFHRYINPEREVDRGALEVHGIENDFLATQPKFADVAAEFVEFVNGAELVIHNADFDVEFLNHELKRLPGMPQEIRNCCGVLDTLALARRLHPGQRNSLDALAKRYNVDNSKRELHGALLDAQILADIYLAMTGGQVSLSLESEHRAAAATGAVELASTGAGSSSSSCAASAEEERAHEAMLAVMAKRGQPIWRELERETAGPRGAGGRMTRRATRPRAGARRVIWLAAPRGPYRVESWPLAIQERRTICARSKTLGSASSGSATSGLPLAVEFGKHYPTVGFDIKKDRIAELESGDDSTLETTRRSCGRPSTSRTRPTEGARGLQHVHRHGADAGRQEQPARADAAEGRERDRRQRAEEGRRRRLRVDGLSRLHGRVLRADPRAAVGAQVQQGFLLRLQPRAHQSRRQAASAADDQEGHVGLDARDRRLRRRALSAASSRPARTRRRASKSPRRPKSSRTRSATSTSR